MSNNVSHTPREKTLFSVVIPHYRGERECVECIRSLVAQTMEPSLYEILVVDDGFTMTKDAVAQVSAMKGVTVTQKRHTGVCGTRNVGIENARGKYVVLIDHDCVARVDLLEQYRRFFVDNPGYAAAGGRVLGADASGPVARYCSFRKHLGMPIYREGQISAVITANACFQRRALCAVGMFSPEFDILQRSVGGEDQDVSYKLLQRGYRLGHCSEAVVWHRHRETLRAFIEQQTRNGRGLALHCLMRGRSLRELGLPDPGCAKAMLHMARYLLLTTEECPSVVQRMFTYIRARELDTIDKIAFPCMDMIRRLSILVGISRAKRMWAARSIE